MTELLKPGQTVQTQSSGMACTVEQFLGGGGQGEVYRATIGGAPVALKWYFPHAATPEQRQALEMLVQKGPPNDRFLWPLELTSMPSAPGFGYIMPLRDERYSGIADLMKGRVRPSFRALATAGFGLAHSYLQLHARGLCYQDISFGNAFFDPTTGDVLICDNDNVAIDGQANGGVLGTSGFMAPEVVRHEARPSAQTDLFSLAVLLFYMFMLNHPLEGKKAESIYYRDDLQEAPRRLYGEEPVFIFDPNDDSNRPVPGWQDVALAYWPIYPQFLRDTFTQAFTAGIRNPQNGRVVESIWRRVMIQLRDSIVYCPHCKAENFHDVAAMRASADQPVRCWACRGTIQSLPRLRIDKRIVMLNHDTRLYPHHVDSRRLFDFSQPVAAVNRHPTNPHIWGLKNLSGEKWVAFRANGTVRDVEPGRSETLAVGTRINFGRAEGEIRV